MKKNLLSFLALSLFASVLSGCGKQGGETTQVEKYRIQFNAMTDKRVNGVSDQLVKKGMHIKKPALVTLDDADHNYIVFDWYTDANYSAPAWNFRKDYPTSDMTLYAKWGLQFEVNYIVNDEVMQTLYVKENEKVKERLEYAEGFEYYGSFTDKECLTPFDFDTPITQDTNIYVKKSDGVCFYETNKTGALSNYLTCFRSSDANGTAGVVSKVTLEDGTFTNVNFGYAPKTADPYVQLGLNVDITKSQILRFTLKNLGKADSIRLYFTTLMDLEDEIYSATGKFYSEDYSIVYRFDENQMNMSKDGPWTTVDFDLTTVGFKDGYNVWAASKNLGALRIQSCYVNKSTSDMSNEIIFKSIEGIYKEVDLRDTEDVRNTLVDSSKEDIETAQQAQDKVNGFIFPRDIDRIGTLEEDKNDFDVFERTDGILLHTKNELENFGTDYYRSMLRIYKPLDENYKSVEDPIDLEEYCTLNIKLKNYGYQDELSVYIYSDEGDLVIANLSIGTKMNAPMTYSINLYKEQEMINNLAYIELYYTATGIDNALLIQEITFSEFKRLDCCGINFDDKNCCGFRTIEDKVNVDFNKSRSMTCFDVKEDGVEASTSIDYLLTNATYPKLALYCTAINNSHVTQIDAIMDINSVQKTFEFVIDTKITGKVQKVFINVPEEDRGNITALTLKFHGTGKIYLDKIGFELDSEDPHQINLNYDFTPIVTINAWLKNGSYKYDSLNECSIFSPIGNQMLDWHFHIGFAAGRTQFDGTIENPTLLGKSKVKILYRNPNPNGSLSMRFGLAVDEYGSGDNVDISNATLTLNTNMQDYEWAVAEWTIPANWQNGRLGMMVFNFDFGPLYLRAIIVE